MIENMIHQNMMSVIGNIEKPYKNEAGVMLNNTITSPCCVVTLLLCSSISDC